MAELLRQYLRIALLAGRPQDLPGGNAQLQIGVALASVTYLCALVGLYGVGRSIAHVALDLGSTALAMRVALSLVGHPGRFEQAFGGLCGASAVVNAVAVPVYLARPAPGATELAGGPAIAEFALLVWSLSLLAHVLRHTFELRLAASVGVAFLWLIVLLAVMEAVLPPLAPNAPHEQVTGSDSGPEGGAMIEGRSIEHVGSPITPCLPSDDTTPSPRAPCPTAIASAGRP